MHIPTNLRRRFHADVIYMRKTGARYMSRWLAYFSPQRDWTIRLHKFWRGDDLRAPHDHPFDFWTFPLTSYVEDVYELACGPQGSGQWEWAITRRVVKAFRWHCRPAEFRHIVIGRADGSTKPFYTLCIARFRHRRWGFWTTPTNFIYHRDYD